MFRGTFGLIVGINFALTVDIVAAVTVFTVVVDAVADVDDDNDDGFVDENFGISVVVLVS